MPVNSNLPWIILFAPLVSAIVIVLLTQFWRKLSVAIAVAAVLISFVGSCMVFIHSGPMTASSFTWLDFGPAFRVPIGVTIDGLSKTMLLVVTGIGALIHIYSTAYMKEDEGESRYFAGLSLFMFSMLGIVLANNFVMMFIFWELVGASSYLLIGHWYFRNAPPAAANKAFIANRIGDFGFMLGILMLWLATKSVVFTEIAGALNAANFAGINMTAATLLIFCGTVGKSAQFPLHVWLPDAMEGPTPVSALIHAATMVAAGVYMLARVFFLVQAAPFAQEVISWIGVTTAVLAALMATQQNDIKRILAYSTLSQLGYMVMAMGVLAPGAAMFHLFTHAFFKALLFLGAGAIIHMLHHEQNIWKMGGLKSRMPLTFLTFLIATLALIGCPGFSGYFSKEAILAAALFRSKGLFAAALGTAFLTAFYMIRLFVVVFLGKPKSPAAEHGHDAPPAMTLPLLILAVPAFVAGYGFVIKHFVQIPDKEGPFFVTILAVAAFAAGAGFAFLLYAGKTEDPILIPLLANKFYFDELYAVLIRMSQDLLARVSGYFDRWVLDSIVRVVSGSAWLLGFVLRFFQIGNLQAYSFMFGLGIVGLLYFVTLRK